MKYKFRHIIWIIKILILINFSLNSKGNDTILFYKFINTQFNYKDYLYPDDKQEIKVYQDSKYLISIYYSLRVPNIQFINKSALPSSIDINKIYFVYEYSNLNCMLIAEPDSVILKNDTILIYNLKARLKEVTFEKKNYCDNELENGIKVYIPQYYNVYLSISDKNIFYDSSTNLIKFIEAKEGIYFIEMSSEYCLKKYYDSIRIFSSPNITLSEKETKICPNSNKIIRVSTTVQDSTIIYYWSNGVTGTINEISTPGNYIVTAKNRYGCITIDTVKVYEKIISISKLDYKIKDVDCYNTGYIDLYNYEIIDGTAPFKFYLQNITTNDTLDNLSNLKEGKYKLLIKDFENCSTSYEKIIFVNKNCLNDYPILAPSLDRINSTYFIPYEGEAIVFDKNGLKKASFKTPTYWDGNDNNGRPLPTGTYLIVVQNNIIEITIIR